MSYSLASFVRTAVVLCAFVFLLFFSLSSLTENPPTWMDEGAINQVAMNLSERGMYGYQIAPESFVSAEFLTTGYPVVYPVALSFLLFGKSLLSARLVMVLFIVILSISIFWYSKTLAFDKPSLYFFPLASLLLVISFAPLYGHGKNVLGEVPGVTFFALSLLLLAYIEKKHRSPFLFFLAGIFAGLSMATKPLYAVLVGGAAVITFLIIKRRSFSIQEKGLFAGGAFIPVAIWVAIQQAGGSILKVFTYGNVDSTPVLTLVSENLYRLVSEPEVLYFFILLSLWLTSIVVRRKKQQSITTAETCAIIFGVINFSSYLTTHGYYRYFFASEILALAFFPLTLSILFSAVKLEKYSYASIGIITALVIAQGYQLLFHSWVVQTLSSERSALFEQYLGSLSEDTLVFFYHVPEAVLFLPHTNYYQYLHFADTVVIGEENLAVIKQGIPDLLVMSNRTPASATLLENYTKTADLEGIYSVYEKK